jgi:hypothetical protein
MYNVFMVNNLLLLLLLLSVPFNVQKTIGSHIPEVTSQKSIYLFENLKKGDYFGDKVVAGS